jgi:hypothetical protein
MIMSPTYRSANVARVPEIDSGVGCARQPADLLFCSIQLWAGGVTAAPTRPHESSEERRVAGSR